MSPPARKNGSGFTLTELLVALVILIAIMGIPLTLLTSSGEAYHLSTLSSGLDQEAHTVLQRITDRVERATAANTGPAATQTASQESLLYRPVVGYAGGAAPAMGLPERIQLEYTASDPNDGVDNDGDGRIDECVVVWIVDPGTAGEVRTVLSDEVAEWGAGEIPGNNLDDDGNGWVDERGLAFAKSGGRVTLVLTLERVDSREGLVQHKVERVVSFRN